MEEIIEVIDIGSSDTQIKWCVPALNLLKDDKLKKIPTKSKSKIWNAFRLIDNTDSICVICCKHLKYDCKAITSFAYHINKVHGLNLDEEPQKKSKRTMNDYYNRNNQDDIDEIIFRWISNHNIPSTVLDHDELKELLTIFNFKLPHRKSYNKYVEETSNTAKQEIIELMKNSSISLTSDGWSSCMNTNYLGITSRIVTDNFDMFNIWCSLSVINESTSVKIMERFGIFKKDFQITDVESITTDGAPNMLRSSRDFLMKEGRRCYCHNCKFSFIIVQLSIRHTINSIENTELSKKLDSFKELIMKLRNTSTQNDMKRKNKSIKLSNYNVTRWYSLYMSLQKLSKNRIIILEYFNICIKEFNEQNKVYIDKISRGEDATLPTKDEMLVLIESISDISWNYLSSFLRVLKNCYDYNVELQDEGITLSMAHLGLKILINESLVIESNEYSIIKKFTSSLKKELINQFKVEELDKDTLLCCLIDPRTKYFIEKQKVGFTSTEYELSKINLHESLYKLGIIDLSGDNTTRATGKYNRYKESDNDAESQIEGEYARWLVTNEDISSE